MQGLVQIGVVGLWENASLPIVDSKSVQNKLKRVVERFDAAGKRLNNSSTVDGDWLHTLFRYQ